MVDEFQPIQILIDFFIMLVIGNLVILFSKRFKFSASVLLLITGILLSPNTFSLNILGNSGILFFFLYLSIFFVILGLVLDFPLLKIREYSFLIFIIAVIEIFFVTASLYYFNLIFFNLSMLDSFFIAFSIAITSQTILFELIHYKFKTKTLVTIIRGIIFLENLTAIFFLSLLNIIFPEHELSRFEFFFRIFLLTAFVGSLIVVGGYFIPKFINKIYTKRDILFIYILILVSLIAIGGIFIGISPYTLIFILGMIVGVTKAKSIINEIIYPLKSIFSIFFFVIAGTLVNISYLTLLYPIILFIITFGALIKYLSIVYPLLSFGYVSKKNLPFISFMQPGETTLIIALIAYLSNLISPFAFNLIFFVIIFISIFNYLFSYFIKKFIKE